MTLRESLRGIPGIYYSIGVQILDVIVQRIDCFPTVNAPRVIPDQAVVDRRGAHAWSEEVIPAPQERQFLIKHGRLLAFEGEQ